MDMMFLRSTWACYLIYGHISFLHYPYESSCIRENNTNHFSGTNESMSRFCENDLRLSIHTTLYITQLAFSFVVETPST